jgi:hypothetical protein
MATTADAIETAIDAATGRRVHAEHCCVFHGCHFGAPSTADPADACPVQLGWIKQAKPCTLCVQEGMSTTGHVESRIHEGTHRTHCCVVHGCKYGDNQCPVVVRKVEQAYPCEDCGHAGINNLAAVHAVITGTIPRCRHCRHVLKPDDVPGHMIVPNHKGRRNNRRRRHSRN